jgi:hypothetical protein
VRRGRPGRVGVGRGGVGEPALSLPEHAYAAPLDARQWSWQGGACEHGRMQQLGVRGLVLASLVLSALGVGCGDDTSSSGGGGGSGGSDATTSGTSTTTGTTTSTGSSASGEPAELAGITEAHNVARANVQPAAATPLPPLTWDDELAAVAQAYAEECIWEHSDNPYGENLYANTGTGTTPQDVVDGWVSEVDFYDYASNTCDPGEMCGHYTQVVWADSLRLGCGVANCTTGSPFGSDPNWQNWVCNYDPPGNWVGEKPY